MDITSTNQPRIVVLGAGFAGLAFARNFKKLPYQVVLIDKNNYHCFQPLLYQVATGGLEAGSIAFPVRKIFHHYKNVFFRMAHIQEVDVNQKIVHTDKGDIAFDYLVIATGSKTNFFWQPRYRKTYCVYEDYSECHCHQKFYFREL